MLPARLETIAGIKRSTADTKRNIYYNQAARPALLAPFAGRPVLAFSAPCPQTR